MNAFFRVMTFLLCLWGTSDVHAEETPFFEALSINSSLAETFHTDLDKASFDNSVLRLVDQHKNTYFFRGKLPEKGGKFCYECLTQQFRNALSEKGMSLSDDYVLICISLLNCSEAKTRKVECKWFAENPQKGCLWLYPLFGSIANPCHLSQRMRNGFLRYDPDGVRNLIAQLKGMVDWGDPYGRDMVIYLHCHAGKDRTGEAAAAYMMQYQGYSYHDAVSICKKIANRKLRRVSLNAIRWHAYYLRETERYPTIGKID